MKRTILVVAMLCVAAGTRAADDPTQPNLATETFFRADTFAYRIVGLTDFETNGRILYRNLYGFAGANRACRDAFGPDARVASTAEASWRDERIDDDRSAWVAPTYPVVSYRLDLPDDPFRPVDAFARDVGGLFNTSTLALRLAACGHYRDDNAADDGPLSSADGRNFLGACDKVHPIACSAPVRVRVTP